MAHSRIYTVATNVAIAEGQSGPFGAIIRRYGCNCQLDGAGINLIGAGYYDLEASLSFTPTAAGPVTIQFYQDGVAIPGALATAQGTAGEPMTLPVVAAIRNCGCDCNTTLTYTINAVGTIVNLAVDVDKD